MAKMIAASTTFGASIQTYISFLRLMQGKDSMEAYIKRFQKPLDSSYAYDEFAALKFRNRLNDHHTNLMRHHRRNF